jgi:6-phosphogluconolactonase
VVTNIANQGNLAKQLAMANYAHSTKHWKVLFADERCVPLDHADSNFALFTQLLKDWDISAEQVITIDPELVSDPAAAAKAYAVKLEKIYGGFPVIDVVLAGMVLATNQGPRWSHLFSVSWTSSAQ